MKVMVTGRYTEGEIISGPDRFSSYIFDGLNLSSYFGKIGFYSYFFKELCPNNRLLRLMGHINLNNKRNIYRVGLFPFLKACFSSPKLIFVTTQENYTILIYLLKVILKYKIITTVHFSFSYEKREVSILKKWRYLLLEILTLKFSDHLVFVSHILLLQYKKSISMRQKTDIITIGLSNFAKHHNIKKKFCFIDGINIIFYNGINSEVNRGLDDVIKYLSKLNWMTFNITVVGTNYNCFKDYKNIHIINLGLISKNKLENILITQHFTIKGNHFDSFSLFTLECMSMGVIPIIHEKIGISKFVKSRKNGYLYDTGSENSLTDLIKELIEHPIMLEKVSNEAISTSHKLSVENMLQKYKSILEQNLINMN